MVDRDWLQLNVAEALFRAKQLTQLGLKAIEFETDVPDKYQVLLEVILESLENLSGLLETLFEDSLELPTNIPEAGNSHTS